MASVGKKLENTPSNNTATPKVNDVKNAAFLNAEIKAVYSFVFIIALTLTAAALRLYRLDYWSFWVDEVLTLRYIFEIYQGGMWPTQLAQIGPSYWTIGPTLYWFGTNEWSARIGPAMIGIVSIPLLYFVIRHFFNTRVAIVFATFLTFSHYHIHMSQSARYTSSIILFYTLALLFFYGGLRRQRPVLLVLGGIFLAIATVERLFALLLVPVLGVYLLGLFVLPGMKRPSGFNWRHGALLIVSGLVIGLVAGRSFVREPTLWIQEFVNRPGPGPLTIFFDFGGYMSLPLIGVAVVTTFYLSFLSERPERRSAGLYFGAAALVPLITIMALSLVQHASVRYTMIAMTSFFLLAALAIDELYVHARRPSQWLVLGILAVLLIEPVLGTHWYYDPANTVWPNWRTAYAYVDQQRKVGDLVASDQPPLGDYYLGEEIFSIRVLETFGNELPIEQVVAGDQRVWFVISRGVRNVPTEYYAWIEDQTDLQTQLGNIRIFLYTPTPSTE